MPVSLTRMTLFSGVSVALVTLFNDDLSVDNAATAELAAELAGLGMTAIIACGTTGEAFTLDRDERTALLEAVRAAVPADVPVIAGTGAVSAHQAKALTRDAFDAGANGVLTMSPPHITDPSAYFDAVRDVAGDRTLLGYHFPKMSPPGIDLDLLDQLPLDGCKDSSGDPNRLVAEAAFHSTPVYVGNSALLPIAGGLGMQGAILAAANSEPELSIRAFDGDMEAMRELIPAHLAVLAAPPHGIKQKVADRFGTSTASRIS